MCASVAQEQIERKVLDEGLAQRLAWVPGDAGGRLQLPAPSPGGETALIGRIGDGDPLIGAEEAVARQDPAALLRGLGALALLARSRRVVLTIRDDLTRLLATLRRLAEGTVVRVVAVPAVYPQDDASLRCDVAQILDRRPAAFADALVVSSVVLGDVAMALDGEAIGCRWVSVSGAVRRPTTRLFPLGCRVDDAVAAAGGATENVWVAYENGLVSGRRVDADDVIDLATRALVVLPPEHPRVQDAAVPLADRVRQAASTCVQCRLCTEGCPVWLTGGHLEPHLVMRHLLRSFG
ncbi:MAG: SLBB domain-containing protein, partial [Deltaproteobacteria bacterium]|nr:SLBB domain-containing protein [Deltaproteobacteria bacterium]